MVNPNYLQQLFSTNPTIPDLISAAGFLRRQAKRNSVEAVAAKRERLSTVFVHLTSNVLDMTATAEAIDRVVQQVVITLVTVHTCEFCGCPASPDHVFCDECTAQFNAEETIIFRGE